MSSTFTKNKNIEKPANNSYVDIWDSPVNDDFDFIDAAFGSVTSLNATGGSATLSATQYRSLFLSISGAISAPVTYTIPSNVGGMWIVYNSVTDSSGGPHAITIRGGGSGTTVTIPRLARIIIVSDGATPNNNISVLAYVTDNGTVNGTLTVTGATNLQSTLSVTGAANMQSTLAVTGAVAGSSSIADSIGNVRNVPANSQSTSYVLIATDNGKFISTNSGATVPSGVFSVGNNVSIYNNSASSITVTEGSGVTLRYAGTGFTGNRTLFPRGLCTILCVASNEFVITGNGVS
jgi:hypothetical protein